MMRIAVLAVQGAFLEHEHILGQLGAECTELRKSSDLRGGFDGLILPGGESTVQGKLMRELHMFDDLKEMIASGLPVMGTCAGLILLAGRLSNDPNTYFGTLPITVRRNAYGRQLGSFSATAHIQGLADETQPFPLEFIRAPYIAEIHDASQVYPIATIGSLPDGSRGENIVGVRCQNQLGFAFHPELTADNRCHKMFLEMCEK